jgi:hypothetical protein
MTFLETLRAFLKAWHGAEPSIKVFTLILACGGLIGWIAAIIGFAPERRRATKCLNTVWLIKR